MKKIFVILLLTGGLLTSGCSDWLDVLPKDKQSTDMYWQSAEDVESILAQGYSCMRNCIPYMIDWGELRGGSVIVPSRATENGRVQNFQVLPNNSRVAWGYILPSHWHGECCIEICAGCDGERRKLP